jgi:hypothetical protein
MGAYHLRPQQAIEEAIRDLDSLREGKRAVERIVLFGQPAVPHLAHLLLDCPPRTIAAPRCLAVRALGLLGAYSILLRYFERYSRPSDSVVLFAEDAVRSAAATELAQTHRDDVYPGLLEAAKERATNGLVQALGEFGRPESVPLFFELLEDDLCRTEAMTQLRRTPVASAAYAMLLLRRCTDLPIDGSSTLRRRRATLQLPSEFGIPERDWPEIRPYLHDHDLDCVIAAARIGLSLGGRAETEGILKALIAASARMNWAQEMAAMELLDQHHGAAAEIARSLLDSDHSGTQTTNWMSPFWRVLHHVLGGQFQQQR